MFVKPSASERPCWRTALSKAGSKDGPSIQMFGSMESHRHVKGGDGTAPGSSSLDLSMQESRTGLTFGVFGLPFWSSFWIQGILFESEIKIFQSIF